MPRLISKIDGWYKKKSYSHFDISQPYNEALLIVSDPDRVSRHSFFPFIGYIDKKRRFRREKDPSGLLSRKARKTVVSIKERELKYCSHVDGYIHSYYANIATNLYEKYLEKSGFSSSILGYRRGIGTNIHMANSAFQEISAKGNCSVIALDIKKFFDSIDHFVLKKNLQIILNIDRLNPDWFAVYKSMTKFSSVELEKAINTLGINAKKLPKPLCSIADFDQKIRKQKLIETNKNRWGIPQGSPISAVFSNIYMIEFDKKIFEYTRSIDASYRRYSDDILIVCPTDERDNVINFIKSTISVLGTSLSISDEKTEISDFSVSNGVQTANKPIGYLGFTFNGKNAQLRHGTISRYYRRMTYSARSAVNTANKNKASRVFARKLLKDFSHLGKANLYTYVRRASEILKDDYPKRQLRRHMIVLKRKIRDLNK